jgi:PAS domain S-box-containing protein
MSLEAQNMAKVASYGLADFGLRDMIECGRGVRSVAQQAGSMEQAARMLVAFLRESLTDEASLQKDCALVRCFKTHPLRRLPPALRDRAHALLTHHHDRDSELPCLTLLASSGDIPAWNSRFTSAGHAVIPLESIEVVDRAPMISQLIRQMGFDLGAVLAPTEELLLESDERAYGVFHVQHAPGSPFIPSQQSFIKQHRIESVVGFGGLLPSGDLFAMILFSRVPIARRTADLFRTLALSVKLVLLPFTRGRIFDEDPPVDLQSIPRTYEQEQIRSEVATLKLLIPALEDAAMYQTERLEHVVTDLKLQAEEVKDLGARLGSILESTTDAVYLLDREWRFTYLNQNAIALLDAKTDLLGKNIWDEFPAAAERDFWQHYHSVMIDGVPLQFEEHYPEPLDRWFEVHAYPNRPGIAVFFHDITARRRTHEALIKSEKLAAVGRLAASIAHEINNPLESVTNLLYLARTSKDFNEVQEYLSTADRELRRVGAITNQTLRFHKQSSNRTEVTCQQLIEDVLSIYHGRIVNSRVQVERRGRAERPVLCFEGEIRQVLNNLVGNAIDAMHPCGGRLLLRHREATEWKSGSKGLTITVADTGSGMSTATIGKCYEPFFTTKGIGGTGLGLWISREIITRHQGRLRLRSSQLPGCTGTVFTVFLPFKAAAL